MDLADVVALLGGQRGLQREVRQPDDGVHRCPDLVAHVGEEHRLQLRRLLGLLPRRRELHLLRLELFLLGQQLLLRLRQLVGLLLELPRLLLRLAEQLLRPDVAGQDLEAHPDDRQQLVEQGLLVGGERPERRELEDREKLVLGRHGPGRGLGRSGLADARYDAQCVRRDSRQARGLALPRALAREPFACAQPLGSSGGEAVARDPAQALAFAVEEIERCNAASEDRDERRDEAGPERVERRGTLQLPRDLRGVRLDPALLVHGHRALLEHVDRAGELAGLIRRLREWHRSLIVASGDRLDARLKTPDRANDPAERQGAESAREREGEPESDHNGALRALRHLDDRAAGRAREILVVSDPFAGRLAQPHAEFDQRPVERCEGLVAPAAVRERQDPLGGGDPLAAHAAVLIQKPSFLIVRNEAVGVKPEQASELRPIGLEKRAGPGPRLRVLGQKDAPKVHAELGERLRHVPERGQTLDLVVGEKAAPLFDSREPLERDDPEGQQNQERDGQDEAERVAALAAELRELAPAAEVLLDAVPREIERAEQRTGARPVLGGVDVGGHGLAVAGFAEHLRGFRLVLPDADAVPVRPAHVDAAAEVRGLAGRPPAAPLVEREGPGRILLHPAAALVEEAEVRARRRAPQVARLGVSGGRGGGIRARAAPVVRHQPGVVAALGVAEVARPDVEPRRAHVVLRDELSGRIEKAEVRAAGAASQVARARRGREGLPRVIRNVHRLEGLVGAAVGRPRLAGGREQLERAPLALGAFPAAPPLQPPLAKTGGRDPALAGLAVEGRLIDRNEGRLDGRSRALQHHPDRIAGAVVRHVAEVAVVLDVLVAHLFDDVADLQAGRRPGPPGGHPAHDRAAKVRGQSEGAPHLLRRRDRFDPESPGARRGRRRRGGRGLARLGTAGGGEHERRPGRPRRGSGVLRSS